MPLLGEDENAQKEGVQPSGGIDQGQQAILAQLQSRQQPNPITINDFQSGSGNTGALHETDYFPGINTPIGVGNSSGSIIGSHTNYAPTNYVPFGLMDARDAAISKAALQKQLDAERFLRDHQRPVTKDTEVQPFLTDLHDKYLSENVARFKKTYGKNWAAAANQDIPFQTGYNNLVDTAKHYDALIDHVHELDAAEKDPNFVKSDAVRNEERTLHEKLQAISANPSDPKALGLVNHFLHSKASYDLDVVANNFLSKIQPDISEQSYAEASKSKDGTNRVINQLKETYYDEKKMLPGMISAYKDRYAGDPNAPTFDAFKESVMSKTHKYAENKINYHDLYHAPQADEGKLDDYSKNQPQTNIMLNTGTHGNGTVFMLSGRSAGATDTQTKLQHAGNPLQSNLQTGQLNTSAKNFVASPQGVYTVPVNTKTGHAFPTEADYQKELENNPKNVHYITRVVANETSEKDSKTGTQKSHLVQPEEVKGRLKARKGTEGFDGEIKKQEEETRLKNEELKKAEKAVTPTEGEEQQVQGGTAVYKNGKWVMKK